jgi:CHAT domain-containing protein
MDRCRILHIAAHAFTSTDYDSNCDYLALTSPGGRKRRAENDGRLRLEEIPDLDMVGCKLVVLSACETNCGKSFDPLKLEPDHSLARAFLVAGAERVMASQWMAEDVSTAKVMGHFFRQIADDMRGGASVEYARALCEAKRKLRRNPDYASPFYWAPFVLVGPASEQDEDYDVAIRGNVQSR